jgi:hypothetical protein
MKKILLLASIIFSHLFLFAGNEYAITTTNLNLRENNSKNSTSLKVLNQGDTLEILSTDQNWTKVKVDNIEGYVSSEFLLKIENQMNLAENESSTKKTFKDQKGFVAGFKFVFIRIFILIFLIVGSIITYSLRKRDARFKKGYREGQMSNSSLIKLAIYSSVVSLIAGFVGGIISIFH